MEMSVLSEGTPGAEMSDMGTAAKTQGSRGQRSTREGRQAAWRPGEVNCYDPKRSREQKRVNPLRGWPPCGDPVRSAAETQ